MELSVIEIDKQWQTPDGKYTIKAKLGRNTLRERAMVYHVYRADPNGDYIYVAQASDLGADLARRISLYEHMIAKGAQ